MQLGQPVHFIEKNAQDLLLEISNETGFEDDYVKSFIRASKKKTRPETAKSGHKISYNPKTVQKEFTKKNRLNATGIHQKNMIMNDEESKPIPKNNLNTLELKFPQQDSKAQKRIFFDDRPFNIISPSKPCLGRSSFGIFLNIVNHAPRTQERSPVGSIKSTLQNSGLQLQFDHPPINSTHRRFFSRLPPKEQKPEQILKKNEKRRVISARKLSTKKQQYPKIQNKSSKGRNNKFNIMQLRFPLRKSLYN